MGTLTPGGAPSPTATPCCQGHRGQETPFATHDWGHPSGTGGADRGTARPLPRTVRGGTRRPGACGGSPT